MFQDNASNMMQPAPNNSLTAIDIHGVALMLIFNTTEPRASYMLDHTEVWIKQGT